VGRLALAASILLFFLSYLFLSGLFPTSPAARTGHQGDIGKLDKAPKAPHVGAPSPK
jgi:hypothetical protein